MRKLEKTNVGHFPKLIFVYLVSLIAISLACNSPGLYKKEFSPEQKLKLAEKMTTNLRKRYGQGTVSEISVLNEGLKLQPESAELWRTLGIPYLKRGYAAEYFERYEKAVKYDPLNWQGYRGHFYLYYYRDYERALHDFNQLDALTPNFVDHPQATSVHFLRAVCHLKLGQFEEAHAYWDKHIAEEIETIGEDYIDSKTFLFQGITYYKQENYKEAMKSLAKGIKYDRSNADLHYWAAKTHYALNDFTASQSEIEIAKNYHRKGSFNSRDYMAEFYQTYMLDIVELERDIEKQIHIANG